MEDMHTRKMLDSLADLFLTGQPQTAQGPAPAAVASAGEPSQSRTPQIHINHAAIAQQLEGPQPIRLGPAVTAPRTNHAHHAQEQAMAPSLRLHPSAATAADVAAELDADEAQSLKWKAASNTDSATAVATADDDDDQPALTAPVDARYIEAVFLGSLPGFAGPWLTQYAQFRARSVGIVGVIYLDEDQVDVELVIHGERESSIQPPRRELIQAIDAITNVGQWLINIPVPPTPQMMQQLDAVASWTILTGSDDAAAAAVDRLVGQLLDAGSEHERESSEPLDIGIAIMGCDQDKANHAHQHIHRLVHSSTASPVTLRCHVPQMGPVSTQVIGSFANNRDKWANAIDLMCLKTHQQAHRRIKRQSQSTPKPAPGTTPGITPGTAPGTTPGTAPGMARAGAPAGERAVAAVHEPAQTSAPPRTPAPDIPPSSAQVHDQLHQQTQQTPQPPITPMPTHAPPQSAATAKRQTAATASPAQHPDLSIYLAGSMNMQARCPKFPHTQLALDQEGRIHLLHQHVQQGDDLQSIVLQLIEVRRWVVEHRELLQLTQRQCRFDACHEPILHLFTDQAKLATALIGRLGSFMKLHLLTRITVGNDATWFCADLN